MKTIDSVLSEVIRRNNAPSVQYILFDRNGIIKKFSAGLADIHKNKNAGDDTTYNAFSVTKTFTALAIMQLVEQKDLDIERPIKDYLPEIPYSSEITIRQVLSHSAGIPNPVPLKWIHLAAEHKLFDPNKFFFEVLTKNPKLKSAPNEKYAYSNLGYVLLGLLIEKSTGQSYEAYVNKNIIERLGIDANDLGFEIFQASLHAKGYLKRLSLLNFILGLFIDKPKYLGKAEGRWKPFKNFYVNGVSYGGLIGKPLAFVKYIQELLKPDNKLISDRYKELLFSENFTHDNVPTGMCLAWFKGNLNGHRYFAHAGGGGGYYCEIRIYPDLESGLGSVIFFNRTGISDERFLDKTDAIFLMNYDKSTHP